jgi:hypothetical protein
MPLQGLPRRRLPLSRNLEALPTNFIQVEDDLLSSDHSDNSTFRKTPGEPAAMMIKTMLDLDAQQRCQGIYKVGWSNRAKLFLDNVGTSAQAIQTTPRNR